VRGLWVIIAVVGLACDPGEPDFALVAPSDPVVLVLGQVGEIEVGLERLGGFDRTVVVTAGGLRAGITPGTVLLSPGQDQGTLTVAVETSAVEGPIDGAFLIGLAGDLERSVAIDVTVIAP
jgi:hypothetical protein